MSDVVTLGETMALVAAPEIGLLRHATSLRLSCGGAESNVAVGVARLGHRVAWIGRVGADEFGVMVRRMLAAEGVEARVRVDPDAPTGLMVKYRRTGTVTQVLYYRKGSAGSRLDRSDIDADLIRSARVLHLTGITPALSQTARDAVGYAVEVAAEAGVTVCLDLNYRSKLWSPEQAGPVLAGLVARADILFATEPEARLVVDGTGPAELGRALAALGPGQVVIKRGALGAVAVVDGEALEVLPYPVTEVDPVGAGDAFAAGYLSTLLDGGGPVKRLDTGALAGAFAVTVPGDWEGLPHPTDLELLRAQEGVLR
ncbi:MAG: sugar kinase [Actinobacteria bacterium]|nr:MAG: sugar kinase [Actinomycetota bacterium]